MGRYTAAASVTRGARFSRISIPGLIFHCARTATQTQYLFALARGAQLVTFAARTTPLLSRRTRTSIAIRRPAIRCASRRKGRASALRRASVHALLTRPTKQAIRQPTILALRLPASARLIRLLTHQRTGPVKTGSPAELAEVSRTTMATQPTITTRTRTRARPTAIAQRPAMAQALGPVAAMAMARRARGTETPPAEAATALLLRRLVVMPSSG